MPVAAPFVILATLWLAAAPAVAKLPAPVLSDEAKAKAAEAAAKTAHGNKVTDFQLCRSMDRVAEQYRESLKKAGKAAPAPTTTAACADPGAFVFPPPTVAAAGAPAVAAAPPAAGAKPAPAKK